MNVFQKLVEVRKQVTYLQKEKDGAQYKYVSSSQVLSAVRDKMDEVGLVLVPRITGHKLTESVIEYRDQNGNPTKRTITYFTEIDMTMTWVNADKPDEMIECPWYAQGVDIAGEKGVGKALTYGEKTFMLKQFNIPTDTDDPDMIQHPPRHETYSPPIGAGKKQDDSKQNDDLAEIERASKENIASFSELSEGQIKMLNAKAIAAGFKQEDKQKLVARVSAFLGYPIRDFNNVKKADVTKLAQYLDKQKKTAS